ncbi:MAG: hypothetical protein KZQ66_19145 [Candidatus Thiodiazotropha sp. (ex Lucinoma aequizonata)]|nr:hypothetical protein [Candidatus Thiodiazotropha sp. (ex Lucinoma aequizonata)]
MRSVWHRLNLAKKDALVSSIGEPLSELAANCVAVWDDVDALDKILLARIDQITNCEFLYAWDIDGKEISSLILPGQVENSWRGMDLSRRHYLKKNLPFKGIMLSSVYHS